MLVAGYEQQFNESLRYWRTRFIVIPTTEPAHHGITNDKLNEEEIRILGIEKLGELFSRVRWQSVDEKPYGPLQPVRLLPTYLSPSAMLSDDHLVDQLDDIHAAGPLRKKMKSERDLGELSNNLSAVARAMREDGGVPIKEHRWHKEKYPESFVGQELVSWLVREFRDVSSREQATEWGVKLLERGLFEHCTGRHGFLDG
jgi:DEP domain-containing protein 5